MAAVAVVAVCLARLDPSVPTVARAAAAGILVWIAAIDLESRLLPDRLVLSTTAALLATTALFEPARAGAGALAALGAFGFLLAAAALRPGALGMGDVKLALLLGALLGGAVLQGLVLGFSLAAIAALTLIARRGRAALKVQIPLGPFLAAGAIAALLLGGSAGGLV